MTVDLAKMAEQILTAPYRLAGVRQVTCWICGGYGYCIDDTRCRMCNGKGYLLVDDEQVESK